MTTNIDTAQAITAPVASSQQTLGITSLVLGIASIALSLTFIVPIAAIVVGILALQREATSRTLAIWGIVTGGFALAGGFILALIGLALFVPFGLVGLGAFGW
jgi:hypothetical protein